MVDIKMTSKICNFNDKDLFMTASDLRVWYKSEGMKYFLKNKKFPRGTMLKALECRKETNIYTVSTKTKFYNMDAKLQGNLVDASGADVPEGNCFAYSFNNMRFKYDYGDGECLFSVSCFRLNGLNLILVIHKSKLLFYYPSLTD